MSGLRANPERTALFVSTQHWHSHFRIGSHHIAREFARRGWKVGFLSAPVSPLHLLGFGEQSATRLRSWRSGGTVDAATGIWHFVPFALMPWAAAPVLRHRSYLALASRTCVPGIRATLARAGMLNPTVGYTDHFLHAPLLRLASPQHTVFRIADRLDQFPGAGRDFWKRTLELAQGANTVVTTTEHLAQKLPTLRIGQLLVIGNGVDLNTLRAPTARPPEYGLDDRPIAIHVGSTESWVDTDLLARLSMDAPELRVVVIGPVLGPVRAKLRRAGVEVLGPRSHAILPAYLQHANVGLVSFTRSVHAALVADIQPLKLLEYLACGLPVVGIGDFDVDPTLAPCVDQVDTAERFVQAVLARARQGGRERTEIDLDRFSWSTRLERLFARLSEVRS